MVVARGFPRPARELAAWSPFRTDAGIVHTTGGKPLNRHAVVLAALLLAGATQPAHAQAVSQAWKQYREGRTTQAPPPPSEPELPAAMSYQQAQYYRPVQRDGSGFFVGAQLGKGWIYEEIDQDAVSFNAGYRWQAGPVALLGIEVGAGRLADTRWQGIHFDEVKFRSIGFNGRFNFGRHNPWYGIVRAGYWAADVGEGEWAGEVDGGYAGIGVGVDLGRNANLNLLYTSYVYASSYYWADYEFNRADTVTVGIEARF